MTTASADLRLAQRLASEFDLGDPIGIERVARGAVGAVHRLDVRDGRAPSYAIKQLFWEVPTEAAANLEVEFRDTCAEAGVPSPRPLHTVAGSLLVHDQESDTVYRAYEWVDGTPAQQSDPEIMITLAGWMGTMHALALPVPSDIPVDPWYLQVDADWPDLARRARAANLDGVDELDRLLPEIIELTAFVNQAARGAGIWCHRDWQAPNVIMSATGPVLVDWDNSGPMSPSHELGGLLASFSDDVAGAREVTAAYRATGGTAVIDGPECFATSLTAVVNFLAVQLEAQLDPTVPEHHAFGAQAVANVLGNFPDLHKLEQLALAIHAETDL